MTAASARGQLAGPPWVCYPTRCVEGVYGVEFGVNKPFFKAECPSTFEAMAACMEETMGALQNHGQITQDDEPWMRLCLEEALVNAIRHGNHCEPKRKIGIELSNTKDSCTIRVYDEGAGFRPDQITTPNCDQLGGRGVCLIRHFMDQVAYNSAKHRLEMTYHRKQNDGEKHNG